MKSVHRHLPGLEVTDHQLLAPLDHDRPDGEKIEVFCREVVATRRAKDDLPRLVYLQGGPGFEAPRPVEPSGWLGRALEDYRVVLLDQRGTGRSSPMTAQTLSALESPKAQAEYASHFRADAIVRDCELVRKALPGGGTPWTVLGQSYGGFCAVHYLSAAPEGLSGVLITGGLPALDRPVDDVYRATYPRVIDRNRAYFERYPEDRDRVREIAALLEREDVRLPSGGRLTPRRLQLLGIQFGFSDGFETVHYMIEDAFVNIGNRRTLGIRFLKAIDQQQPWDTNPIYAMLHEAIYCQGTASRWSAHRLMGEAPELAATGDAPAFFTGEMIYPWMFEDFAELRPLQEAAEILAAKSDWPALYDLERLAKNTVPGAAAIYANDMFVERAFSEETAAKIPHLRTWITSEYEHNGLRADGAKILTHLLELMHGER
ncbi:MAG: alpha/beta fold hydrolase [Planctomycetota bacterium]